MAICRHYRKLRLWSGFRLHRMQHLLLVIRIVSSVWMDIRIYSIWDISYFDIWAMYSCPWPEVQIYLWIEHKYISRIQIIGIPQRSISSHRSSVCNHLLMRVLFQILIDPDNHWLRFTIEVPIVIASRYTYMRDALLLEPCMRKWFYRWWICILVFFGTAALNDMKIVSLYLGLGLSVVKPITAIQCHWYILYIF